MKSPYLSSYSADIITKEENVAGFYYIPRRVTQRRVFIAVKCYQSVVTPPIVVYDWFDCTSLKKWANLWRLCVLMLLLWRAIRTGGANPFLKHCV